MDVRAEIENIKQAIQALESQRSILGDGVIEAGLTPLREKLAQLEPKLLGERRKLVTVLFADLVGFTDLSANLDPEDVREIMNAYFKRWRETIEKSGGVVEKFIGDAVMAVFGMHTAREDDPENAIRAALEMNRELERLNEGMAKEGKPRLDMRVGINTGPVVVSTLGERQAGEFVVVGDPVNLASRVQAAAPAGGILITYDTYRHVRGLFEVQPFGKLALKGVETAVEAYLVRAAKPRAFRMGTRGVEGVETRMVGREGELQRLQEIFGYVVSKRERQVVTLVGEAGIGKSRLLFEFVNWLELLPEKVYYFTGRAHYQSQNSPYSLLRSLFAFRFQIQDSDSPEVVREKFEAGLGPVFGEEEGGRQRAGSIARLLGFQLEAGAFGGGVEQDAKVLHEQALVYLGDYFRWLAREHPVVVLMEDLHWADDSSLDMVYRLEGSLARLPLLIIGAARPGLMERRPGWGEEIQFHTRLDLMPLGEEAGSVLVQEILKKVEALPAELEELVVRTAEGNPFYIEELIKMLIEDGVIAVGEERWRVEQARLGEVRVPATLTGVLQARFDSLGLEQRDYLQRGAVIGRVFWDRAVEYLKEGKDPPSVLEQLRRREMIFKREASIFEETDEYLFKHALLRDVTYASLLKRQRSVYHGGTARWLEQMTKRTSRSDEFAMLIAEHYEKAKESGLAAGWYLRAGRHAAQRYANAEAVWALTKAVKLTPAEDLSQQFDILFERAKVYGLRGETNQQKQDLEALAGLAEKLGDPGRQSAVALRRADFFFITGEYQESLAQAREAVRQAEESKRLDQAAESYLVQAHVLMRQGELETATQHAQHALDLASQEGLTSLEARSMRILGLIKYYSSKPAEASPFFQKALDLYREIGDRQGENAALINLGGAAFEMGEYARAEEYYARSLELSMEIGDRIGEARASNNLGITSVVQMNYAGAERYYQRCLQISRETGNRSTLASILDNLGNLAQYRYEYSKARKYQEESIQVAQKVGEVLSARFGYINLAIGNLYSGNYAKAYDYLQECLRMNKELNDRLFEGMIATNLGMYYILTGDQDKAQPLARKALENATELDNRSEKAWALHCLGECLLAGGLSEKEPLEEAREALQEAYQIRLELGEGQDAIETLARLAEVLLIQGDLDRAGAGVEEILKSIEEKGVEGFTLPGQVFLACYRVLDRRKDARASQVLEKGVELVQEIALKIEDAVQRKAFLEEIRANRELVQAWTGRGEESG